ncbi:enoyl-CoA hydratase/isomerase family protein [Nitrospirillum amazonense]|uniref:3-hydroxyisobutyryl-CoA hydrolase n=1 Tax=Nitrospirillum amazonense TaxID=28077 RepID=A0A560KH76_9PROT|nr:enoyl-CoA hydratase/isomerase family protein [Nitrospirillum amazonense]MDG3441517.1 enoyl-CoA hydratase/isomerase family protein [Nitrospirillum amazonense]TWB79990.1 3-hydroxyisobutyryl-CoA hydrolase [Nitrospirillum amazonense]
MNETVDLGAAEQPHVICTVRGAIGHVLLNRPKALNALTLDMIRIIDPQLAAWARDPAIKAVVIQGAGDRAFCAGGDVRAVWDSGKALQRGEGDGAIARDFFREEYRLNRRIKRYPKPYIALLDGITMGGGVGLSVHGSHRVTTEKTLLAMPETGIGLFPDVGGGYFLSRLPGELGTYLALTGARLGAADAAYAGIATHHVPSAQLGALVDELAAASYGAHAHATVDTLLARHATFPGEAPLAAHTPSIDRSFNAETVEEILACLGDETQGFDDAWASATVKTLSQMSPTSLKVTLSQLRRGVSLEIEDVLVMEYRMTQAVMAGHDFYEGIRAQLVDKDRQPKWRPTTLAEVSESEVERHFQPVPSGDLTFTD